MFFNTAAVSNNGIIKPKSLLDIDKYSYIMDRSSTGKTYWRYIKYYFHYCHFRLYIYVITNNIIKPPKDHKCAFYGTTLTLRKLNEEIILCALQLKKLKIL